MLAAAGLEEKERREGMSTIYLVEAEGRRG